MKVKVQRNYSEARRADYPSLRDQLDAIWKGGAEMEAMRERVMAVKAKHPKSLKEPKLKAPKKVREPKLLKAKDPRKHKPLMPELAPPNAPPALPAPRRISSPDELKEFDDARTS